MLNCAVCGGARGCIKDYPEYSAHIDCYKRTPIEYVLWHIKEKQKRSRK